MTAESQLDHDLEIISNSLRMLPSWQHDDWWPQFSRKTGHSLAYLNKKIAWITTGWQKASSHRFEFAGDRATYVLMFFDNPALYEHLDAVQPTWEPPVAGGVGRRWVEEICAAAWRVIVATEPDNVNSNNFSVSD
jgi:hypothetical protein